MLDCQRELFDLDQEVTYLNCAYMSPLPKLSLEIGRAAMGREAKPWTLNVDNFFSHTARARELVAGLMEADLIDADLRGANTGMTLLETRGKTT